MDQHASHLHKACVACMPHMYPCLCLHLCRTSCVRPLLHTCTAHAYRLLQVVRSSLVAALAVMVKRGWLEAGQTDASREAVFQVGPVCMCVCVRACVCVCTCA